MVTRVTALPFTGLSSITMKRASRFAWTKSRKIVIKVRRQLQQQQMAHQRRPRDRAMETERFMIRFWGQATVKRRTLTGPSTGRIKTKIRIYFYNNNISSCISTNSTSSIWWTTRQTDRSRKCISTSTWSSQIDISTPCRRFSNISRRSWARVLLASSHQQVSRQQQLQPRLFSPVISTNTSSKAKTMKPHQRLQSRVMALEMDSWIKTAFVTFFTNSSSTISFSNYSNNSRSMI